MATDQPFEIDDEPNSKLLPNQRRNANARLAAARMATKPFIYCINT
jgi:hypothetical protein